MLDLGYGYDQHSNVSAITDYITRVRQTWAMTYDHLDRLTQAAGASFGTATYGYDVLDNLKTLKVTSGSQPRDHTYVYDANNRLTNVTNTVWAGSSMSKKDWITASDLMAELNSDSEYQAMRARKKEEYRRLWESWNHAAQPIVEALRTTGVNVKVVTDLLDGRELDPAIIPVLLGHVKRTEYPDQIREMLLRALASPVARPYWNELVEMFEKNTADLSPAIHYVAALALDRAFNEDKIDDVLRLAKDQRLGAARVSLLLTLKRSKDPRAKMLLLELRDDPDLGKEVKRLRRLERKQSS